MTEEQKTTLRDDFNKFLDEHNVDATITSVTFSSQGGYTGVLDFLPRPSITPTEVVPLTEIPAGDTPEVQAN